MTQKSGEMAMVKGKQDGNTYWLKRDGPGTGIDTAEFDGCDKAECHWKSLVSDLLYELRKHNAVNGKWTGDIVEAKTVNIEGDGHF